MVLSEGQGSLVADCKEKRDASLTVPGRGQVVKGIFYVAVEVNGGPPSACCVLVQGMQTERVDNLMYVPEYIYICLGCLDDGSREEWCR